MSEQSLAVKYRPQTFDDVVEQGNVRKILEQQLKSNTIKHSYLFCGGAGTGKTTCARLFANAINDGKGSPVEMDAASNNSVEDVRTIIQQSRTATLDGSKYRIYIIDECHALSNSAWQAMLKLLEEPPATAIFIFCTTDPQKIPKTILSRVQRYDFQRISQEGIVKRLEHIFWSEFDPMGSTDDVKLVPDALEYIAKLADGGMRDAITLLDKCLAFSNELTLPNVVTAIGAIDYDVLFELTGYIVDRMPQKMIELIEGLHGKGKDLKLFVRTYTDFILDLCKFDVMGNLTYTQIPNYYEENLGHCDAYYFATCNRLLKMLMGLNTAIKWDTNPKAMIEANLYQMCLEEE